MRLAAIPGNGTRTMYDLREIIRRIDKRLEAMGLSDNAASKAAGKPDAIRNMRRALRIGDRQGVTVATIAALAPVLETTQSWLLEGRGPEHRTPADAETAALWSIWDRLTPEQRRLALRLFEAMVEEDKASSPKRRRS
jgi:hypothetical protein